VSGPLTFATVAATCEAGRAELRGGGEVVVDLAGASEVDSAALSLIFEWQREARRHDTRLWFRNLPASLQSLAALYGVSELIPAGA
jgi:phospholipid transport system transporter-binding protein